jgi:hypothetical protein
MVGVAVASVALVSCGSSSVLAGPRGTVTVDMYTFGGPRHLTHVPLTGTVTLVKSGTSLTLTVGASGLGASEAPAGSWYVSVSSPHLHSNTSKKRSACEFASPILVSAGEVSYFSIQCRVI